ncbi:hypothetical protein ENKNEFLB_01640 [Nocardioides aquaticus]|uniref:Heme-binding protein n=1 Tax=Nocardioides aquaticus TaxID=160826 RepID=A0ABX8EFJ3_9ACTN|nr:heme-binding protein [Nocardioides aquaticus]QVT79259.1 hypothetical protein ENKNEFLB_01640 [Nocardioides aquaticus]
MPASLTLEEAEAVLAAAKAKAEEIGQPMNIAVCDDGGHLVVFARMDAAIKVSVDISQRKARTAIMMNLPTDALSGITQPGAELYGLEWTSGGLVSFGGGMLLSRRGDTVGAIGVSAGSVAQDMEVAAAGVAALPKTRDK